MARVASLGIHIVDILGRHVSEIPEGQNLALLDEIRITVAGTAAGTSVDMAKLGLDVYAIGAAGSDGLGDYLVNTMQAFGINTEGIVRKQGVQTSASMLPVRPNGERPALHVPGANAELTTEDIDLDLIAGCDFLHVGGTPLMPRLDGKPLAGIFRFAKERNITTTYDLLVLDSPSLHDKVVECLPWVDYFMPGLEEAAFISGLTERDDIISYFLDKGAGTVVFKMGGEGSIIASRRNGSLETTVVKPFNVPVVDSTGCGDSYCAGFIAGLSKGWSLPDSARLGTACGALVIQGLGSDAGIEDLDKTIAYMKQNS